MKTIFPFLIALTIILPNTVKAQIHKDKLEHFIMGTLITGSTQILSYHLTDNRNQSMLIGFGAGVLAGVAKELYDLSGHGCASYKDLFWTTLGAGATSVSIHYTIQGKSRVVYHL